MTRFVLPIVAVLGVSWLAGLVSAQEGAGNDEIKYKLQVDGKSPFVVANFVAGHHEGKPGCPYVMVSNSRKRGVVILGRGEEGVAQAIEIAKALEEKNLKADQHLGFVVAYDVGHVMVAALAKEAGLQHFGVGVPRGGNQSGEKLFQVLGITDKTDTVVTVVDRKIVKGIWLLSNQNETKDSRAIVAGEAEKMILTEPEQPKANE